MNDLSILLNKNSNNHLWLGIIGVTDHFIFEKISLEDYSNLLESLRKEVLSKNSEKGSKMEVDDGLEIKVCSDERIVLCKDYKFPLYRHWNIYDSMNHSPYVASRLQLWQEKGRSKMKAFLAKMGIPLEECQQNFQNMKLKFKEEMSQKMKKYAKYYGLEDIFFDSFYKVSFNFTYTEFWNCIFCYCI